jgi:hypothetical protein
LAFWTVPAKYKVRADFQRNKWLNTAFPINSPVAIHSLTFGLSLLPYCHFAGALDGKMFLSSHHLRPLFSNSLLIKSSASRHLIIILSAS